MNEHFVLADGGEPGNEPFSPPTFRGRENLILSISKGDLTVPTPHFQSDKLGLRYQCPITGQDLFRLVPRCASLNFNYLGDALCNAMDADIRVMPASVPRGSKCQVVRPPRQKYVCFGATAARGHTGINKYQPALEKLSAYDQEVLMKYVEHADKLQDQFLPYNEIHTARQAMKLSNAITFNLPNVKGKARYFGSWAVGKCVVLNMHQDLGDFLWSDTSVHCRGPQSDRILAYFCFPTIGLAVPLRAGDHLLFNPAVPHMISSRSRLTDEIYCMSLYTKKSLIGGNDNSASLSKKETDVLSQI